jgi:hypothetical protein
MVWSDELENFEARSGVKVLLSGVTTSVTASVTIDVQLVSGEFAAVEARPLLFPIDPTGASEEGSKLRGPKPRTLEELRGMPGRTVSRELVADNREQYRVEFELPAGFSGEFQLVLDWHTPEAPDDGVFAVVDVDDPDGILRVVAPEA